MASSLIFWFPFNVEMDLFAVYVIETSVSIMTYILRSVSQSVEIRDNNQAWFEDVCALLQCSSVINATEHCLIYMLEKCLEKYTQNSYT